MSYTSSRSRPYPLPPRSKQIDTTEKDADSDASPRTYPIPIDARKATVLGKRKYNNPGFSFLYAKRQRQSCETPDVLYHKGVVKPVRLYGRERTNDITLPEVLRIDGLDEAVISSSVWDKDWLLGPIGLSRIKTTWIMDPRTAGAASASLACRFATREGLHQVHYPPPTAQYGCAHGKLMLLFRSDGFLRIVVPTGNMRRIEWGAPPPVCGERKRSTTETLDNAVFIVDLPQLQDEPDPGRFCRFQRSLIQYVGALGFDFDFQLRLHSYDFAACERFGFVYTGGPQGILTGLGSLALAVKKLQLVPPNKTGLQVTYQTSSLGKLSACFVLDFFKALLGNQQHKDINYYTLYNTFRICFPSRKAIVQAPNSECRDNLYSSKVVANTYTEKILQHCLVDIPHNAALSHAKLLRIRWDNKTSEGAKGWLLVGSHNLSQAAWQKRSYECSVLIPEYSEKDFRDIVQINQVQNTEQYSLEQIWVH